MLDFPFSPFNLIASLRFHLDNIIVEGYVYLLTLGTLLSMVTAFLRPPLKPVMASKRELLPPEGAGGGGAPGEEGGGGGGGAAFAAGGAAGGAGGGLAACCNV